MRTEVHPVSNSGSQARAIPDFSQFMKSELSLYPFQAEMIQKNLSSPSSIIYNASSMGCLSGDTLIKVSRNGGSRAYPLRDIFKRHTTSWDRKIPMKVRSLIKEHIRLHEATHVVYQGEKLTYQLTLKNGYSIRATADHEIFTKRGFVRLDQLQKSDLVGVDVLKKHQKKKNPVKVFKPRYSTTLVGKYSKIGYRTTYKGKTIYQVEKHRAVWDAFINGVTLEEFKEITKSPNKLLFTDPKKFHIHHKDGNCKNNELSNLECLSVYDHQCIHAGYHKFGHGKIRFSGVKSIQKYGVEDVYDIVCTDPHRNFVANGIVVHNCGKSVEATMYANVRLEALRSRLNRRPRLLVVCPAAIRTVWFDELKTWLLPDIDYAVVSYTKLVRDRTFYQNVLDYEWDGIIGDENHKCRSLIAQTTRQFFGLWNSVREFAYGASATPIEYSAYDLFPFLTATAARLPYLSKETQILLSDDFLFGNTFCKTKQLYRSKNQDFKFQGVVNEEALKSLLYDEMKFFFMDLKKDVLPDLPPVRETVMEFELTKSQSKQTEELETFLSYEWLYSVDKFNTSTSTLRRLLGIAKAANKDLLDYINNILEQGEPLVLQYYHTEVGEFFAQYFSKYKQVLYRGGMNDHQRQEAKQNFQKGDAQLFIGQINAAGEGLTLTKAANVVITEMVWLPKQMRQFIDRIHRIGQTRAVVVHWMLSDSNFDRHMMKAMQRTEFYIDKITGVRHDNPSGVLASCVQ